MSTPLTIQAAKASLISSLASSQQALARILNSIANVADHSPETAKLLRENVRVLTDMQRAMGEAVAVTALNDRSNRNQNSKSQSAKTGKSTGAKANRSGKTGKLWSPLGHDRSRTKTGSARRKAGKRHAKK
jgi:hypothetical protein